MKAETAMQKKGKMISDNNWSVYVVRCSDGTLYTGITKDLERRITEHNSEKGGAKYTKPRRPVRLVYSEQAVSRSAAAQREYQIKKMELKKKKKLINRAAISYRDLTNKRKELTNTD